MLANKPSAGAHSVKHLKESKCDLVTLSSTSAVTFSRVILSNCGRTGKVK